MPGKHTKPSGYKMKYQGNNSAFPFKSPIKQKLTPESKVPYTTVKTDKNITTYYDKRGEVVEIHDRTEAKNK